MIITTPHTRGSGYFLNNSSGVLRKEEADIRICSHCEVVILLQKWKEDGGWCGRCMAPICGPCSDRMLMFGCEPFIRKIEAAFESVNKLGQFRKLAGLDAPPADFQPKIMLGA